MGYSLWCKELDTHDLLLMNSQFHKLEVDLLDVERWRSRHRLCEKTQTSAGFLAEKGHSCSAPSSSSRDIPSLKADVQCAKEVSPFTL